jgi:FMN phosphatase YigB (HAD superfamily)
MDKKLTILVDFDHTLFDTSKFVRYLLNSPKTIDYRDFLYPDSIKFIKSASKFGRTVLFSEGDIEFQKEKIKGTGVGKMFSGGVKIFSSFSKMQELPNLFKDGKIVVIDDKPEIVDKAILGGCKTIRIKQGKHRAEKTKFRPDFEVGSLSEIIAKGILQSI